MNIIYQECPITIIENMYLKDSMMKRIITLYTPSYNKIAVNDITFQYLVVGIMIVTSKILLLLMKHTFTEYIHT